MLLSPRLDAVLAAAGRCELLADVCSDHALVALGAVARGSAARAVAVDLRRAPLVLAARHLRLSGLEGRVLLVRGRGLAAVRRAEVVVVAGVGGDLAAQLLTATDAGARRVVVQPNRHAREVRAWALASGFHLDGEQAVEEGGRLHLVLSFDRRAGFDPAYGARHRDAELALGPKLLASVLAPDRLFLRRELERLRGLAGRRQDLLAARAALEELFKP